MAKRPVVMIVAAIGGLLLTSGAARADAIDGDWCAPDGRHMSIDGPRIITPAGRRTEGNYSRHAFDYRIPEPEAQAGLTVFMRLLNETTVYLRVAADRAAADQAAAQVWRRCARPTS